MVLSGATAIYKAELIIIIMFALLCLSFAAQLTSASKYLILNDIHLNLNDT